MSPSAGLMQRALQGLSRARPPPGVRPGRARGVPPRRHQSSKTTGRRPPATPAGASTRASRLVARLPAPLRPYASRLRSAPVSHAVAFLVLHEITAVVPLLGLSALFHYSDWVPVAWVTEHCGAYVGESLRRFGRYFARKGWFGFGGGGEGEGGGDVEEEALGRWRSEGKYKVLVEVALAYAVTKALLPVRIVASVWATPWFAGVLVRLRALLGPGRTSR